MRGRAKILTTGALSLAAAALVTLAAFGQTPEARAQSGAEADGPQYVAIADAVTDFTVRQTADSEQNDQITIEFSDGSPSATSHQVVQDHYGDTSTLATFTAGQGRYSHVVAEPVNQSKYGFEVVSTLDDGSTVSSGSIQFATNSNKPPAPQMARVAAFNTANVLAWEHGPFADGEAFRNGGQYEVHRQQINPHGSAGTESEETLVFSRPVTLYHHPVFNADESNGIPGPYFTDQNVTPGTTYRYWVQLRESGSYSYASNIAQITAAPAASSQPANIRYFRDTNTATIEWTNDPAFAFDHFTVETAISQDEPQQQTVAAIGTEMTMSPDHLPGARIGYQFRIRGMSSLLGTLKDPNERPDTDNGRSIPFQGAWSPWIKAEQLPRPSQPTDVSALIQQGGNMVTWSAPATTPERATIESWTIYRGTAADGKMKPIAHDVPASQKQYLDESAPSIAMTYSLRSVSTHRVNSLATTPVQAHYPAALAPRNANAEPDTDQGGYQITWDAPETGTSPSAYQISYTANGIYAPQVRVPANQTSHLDTSVEGFPYSGRIYQITSLYERTPGQERAGGSVSVTTKVLPRPASNLTFTLGFRGVTVTWDEILPHSNDSFEVVRRPADEPDAAWSPAAVRNTQSSRDTEGNHRSAVVNNDNDEASYVYGVRTGTDYATAESETVSDSIAMVPRGGWVSSVQLMQAAKQDGNVRIYWQESWRNQRKFSGYVIGRARLEEGRSRASTSEYEIIGRIDFESVKDPDVEYPDIDQDQMWNMPEHEFIDTDTESGTRYQYGIATLDEEGRTYIRSSNRVTVTTE